MDPFILWVTVAIGGLATFTGWLIKAYIVHLESDIAHARRTAQRGTETAEKATSLAEQKSDA